jgi:CO/xanthine dehydrogenase FAD-binding subunit
MIIEYHRPSTIPEALSLLSRDEPKTVPMGGGTVLNRPSPDQVAVVDLQALHLDNLEFKKNQLITGATVTLQQLLESPYLPPALYKAIRHEATYNMRHAATLAGIIFSSDGKSPLATVLLALDTEMEYLDQDSIVGRISLGDFFARRKIINEMLLIISIRFSLNLSLAYEYVSRTPSDVPIVCVALARWQSGRIRVALGGTGTTPVLACDGIEKDGVPIAAENGYYLTEDQRVSSRYRREMAILSRRCL